MLTTFFSFIPKNFLRVFQFVLSIALYVLSARLGLELATINSSASPVWPAAGVAVSLLYLFGFKWSAAVWIGAFIANLKTGQSLATISLISTGNMLEAMAAFYIVSRLEKSFTFKSSVYANIFRYAAVAVLPTFISATIGTLALMNSGTVSSLTAWNTWITWWVGDTLGVLMVFPLVYEMRQYVFGDNFAWKNVLAQWSFFIKLLIAIAITWGTSFFVFGVADGKPFLFLIFFSVLVTAHLLPFFSIYVASLFISTYSILMTKSGWGPFQSGLTNDSLIHLEFFLSSVWMTAIVLSSLKRNNALKRPTLAFVVGWALAGGCFYSFYESGERKAQAYFEMKSLEATRYISETMNGYTRLLEAGAALLRASDAVDFADWHEFTEGLQLRERYPGLKGIGVIFSIEDQDLSAHVRRQRKSIQDFEIQRLGPKSKNSPNLIITFLEPLKENRPALGLDIATEENRLKAALESARTRSPRLSEPIVLRQSKEPGDGYLLFVPFYDRSRPEVLRGFVYAPVEAKVFFEAATSGFSNDVRLANFHSEKSLFQPEAQNGQYSTMVVLEGNLHHLIWDHQPSSIGSSNLAASLAGFCGAFLTLVLVVLMASLEAIRAEAQKIADEKTIELTLRKERWRLLTENSPIGIFLTDAETKVTYVNRKWIEITGIDVFNFSERLAAAIHPDDRGDVYRAWERFANGELPEYRHQYRIYVEDRLRYIECHAIRMEADDGILQGYMGTIQDQTEQREYQIALATAARMSSLGQMAGGVAHEINNPLAIISGRAELLRLALAAETFKKEDVLEHVGKIQKTVQRIAKIIRGLRSVARESDSEPPSIFCMDQVLQDTLELCQSRFSSHGVELREPRADLKDICILGHAEQITQVLLNLLNNAFDAIVDLSERWVGINIYCLDKTQVTIEIVDSGRGISEKEQRQLFNAFFTTKQVGAGTGLGLSISKGIIEKHGGQLVYDSSCLNTTFKIRLPLASASSTRVG